MHDYGNMLSTLYRPKQAFSFLKIILIAIYRALIVRYLRGYMLSYPNKIRYLAKKLPSYNLPVIHNIYSENFPKVNLKLAIDYFSIDENKNWKKQFDSHEEFVSLHRWNWLLRNVNESNELLDYEHGLSLVRSWFNEMGIMPKGEASESYTVGERISNVCLFSRCSTDSWNKLPSDIQDSLRYSAKFLAHRLEYLPGNMTGNHLINNARALFFAGHCCDIEQAKNLSREILAKHLNVIIDNSGFIREGSSHYQFLITRWLLEIRLLAEETKDTETIEIIKDYLPSMVNACDFFLVQGVDGNNEMVLIGDLSPDCEPAWLLDLTKSSLAQFDGSSNKASVSGWAKLFDNWEHDDSINWKLCSLEATKWRENKSAGWYRLDYDGWTAIWHVESPSGKPIASHAHHDCGTVVLFRNGKEVLIDIGRYEYECNPLSDYGVGASAHSTITIDGFPMILSRRNNRFPKAYRYADIKVSIGKESEYYKFTIEHNGFNRLPGNVGRHSRDFVFSKNALRISDSIKGSGSALLETYFQWPNIKNNAISPGLYKNLKENLSNDTGFKLDITSGSQNKIRTEYLIGSEEPLGGWRFKSFGKKELAVTQKITSFVNLPCQFHYEISEKVE